MVSRQNDGYNENVTCNETCDMDMDMVEDKRFDKKAKTPWVARTQRYYIPCECIKHSYTDDTYRK